MCLDYNLKLLRLRVSLPGGSADGDWSAVRKPLQVFDTLMLQTFVEVFERCLFSKNLLFTHGNEIAG